MPKRTYILDEETVREFEALVPQGKRGACVNEALIKYLEEKERERLRAEILRGLQESRELDAQIEREWAPLSDELWSQLEDEEWPEPAIVWPEGLGAEREKYGGK